MEIKYNIFGILVSLIILIHILKKLVIYIKRNNPYLVKRLSAIFKTGKNLLLSKAESSVNKNLDAYSI